MALLLATLGCSDNADTTPIGGEAGSGSLGGTGGGSAGTSAAGASAGSGMAGLSAGSNSGGGGAASVGGSGNAGGGVGGTAGPGGAGGTMAAGGSAGGSAGGGGGAGGGASADCSSFKLCDDFEGDALGMGNSPWKTSMSGGYTLTLATDQAHSGTHSVHVSAPTGTGSAAIQETKTFPATDFWGRAFLRFKAPPGGHQMFIALNSAQDQLRLLNTLGSAKIQLNLRSNDQFKASATTIPMDTWFCYEWHVAPNSVNVFVDGKALTDAMATWSTANLTSLRIGYERFQTGTAAGEIWIDDVAINSTQIGCQ